MLKRFFNQFLYKKNIKIEKQRILNEYEELIKYNFVKKIKIGESVNKEDINLFEISDNSDNNLPAVKIICNIHGNEITGIYLWLNLLKDICKEYENFKNGNINESNQRIAKLIKNLKICIIPTMNPDNVLFKRENANNVDLNRDFRYNKSNYKYQPETQALINSNKLYNFTISLECHDGAVILTYPNDLNLNKTKDDDTFEYICRKYLEKNKKMKEKVNPSRFKNGYIMGSLWYPIFGSHCDYMYHNHNIKPILIEYSKKKKNNLNVINNLYLEHKEASINFLELGLESFQMIILNNNNKSISVKIMENSQTYYTNSDGYLSFYVKPGIYNLIINNMIKKRFIIPNDKLNEIKI